MSASERIAANLAAVQRRIVAACRAVGRPATEVMLLAVSKTQDADSVRAALAAGQRDFGENRVQELVAKAGALSGLAELQWHLVGSLQTNKVRELLGVSGLVLLHSLDRRRLADELQRELARTGRRLDVLLQIHATDEVTKHGCPPTAAPALLEYLREHCPLLAIEGLMAMGPVTGNPLPVFHAVTALRDALRCASGLPLPILSLGMTGDLEAAIAAGSTLVRIGTGVFGART